MTVGRFISWCVQNCDVNDGDSYDRWYFDSYQHFVENGDKSFKPSDKDTFYTKYLKDEYIKKLLPYKVEHLRSLVV